MKSKYPTILLAIVFSATFVCIQIKADQEPNEYPDTSSPQTDSSCPGVGTCSRTVTPGDYYCDSCWFWDCGCQCYSSATLKNVYHQVGDCSLKSVTVTVKGVTTTTEVATCDNWQDSFDTSAPGTVCWTPDAA